MYNMYPMYGMPQPGMMGSPYSAGMNSMPNAVSPMYDQPMVSNIPPYPSYPGMENYAHNRVPEIQVPELAGQEAAEAPEAGRAEAQSVKNSKGGASKAAGGKVKTSSQTTTAKAKTSSKTGSSSNERSSTAKKKKNPWISN